MKTKQPKAKRNGKPSAKAFEQWMRSAPVAPIPVEINVKIRLADWEWAMLLNITQTLQCTLDEAIEDIVCGDNLCNFHNNLPDPEKVLADDARENGEPAKKKDALITL